MGDKNEDNGEDDAQKQQHGQRQADGALQLSPPDLRCLGQGLVPQPLHHLQQQVYHIGDADAQQQRRQQGEEAVHHCAQGREIIQPPVQQDGAEHQQ